MRSLLCSVFVLLTLAVACGDDSSPGDRGADSTSTTAKPVIDPGDAGDYHPDIDPANFVDGVDNPYMPLLPGSRWLYEGASEDGTETIEVTVTDERKTIQGIEATVVRDTVKLDGEVIEDTWDWFAQDKDGNVWYLGEDTKEYEDGKVVSTEGSWEHGVDGAIAGIIMLADPQPGTAYRQEYYPGEALDLAEVARMDPEEKVRAGSYRDVLVIKEWNPLEPDVVEEKYYASGVGTIAEVKIVGDEERVELIEFVPGR